MAISRTEFVALLEPLRLMLRQEIDQPTWTVYYRALADVPAPLLQAAVDRAGKSCTFLPRPSELRQFADEARTALLAANAFASCGVCSDQGWTETEIDGVKRQVRCRCWTAHQQKIQALGVGSQPVALPAGVEAE